MSFGHVRRRLVAHHLPERRAHAVVLHERTASGASCTCSRSRTTASLSSRRATSVSAALRARRETRRRRRPAVRADAPGAQPAHQCVFRHHDLDDDQRRPRSSMLVERVGLRDRSRKPVEDESPLGVRPREPLARDADDDVVGDEPPGVHHLLGREAHRRARLDGVTQDVARRDARHPAARGELLRLRALPAPGGPSITSRTDHSVPTPGAHGCASSS